MPGTFDVAIETHFSAAHSLRGYPGDCARLHGHNWIVRLSVRCRDLDATGIGIDFRILKGHVAAVLEELDHSCLNDLPPFQETNPSAENIARYLYLQLGRRIDSDRVRVARVGVSETADATACYWEE
ncbi:MAG: 6-carboxytetrahydropterin synthase QueD [Syntrophales bacterium]